MKLVRRLILITVLVAGTCWLGAEEQSSTAQPASQQQATTTEPARRPDGSIGAAQQELAHTSNEAAGEEKDETRQFKESASVQWVASHTGLSLPAAYWVLVLLNFAIIIALIVWGWKKNIPSMFRARTENIRKNLEEARRASEDANRRLGDIENRLSRLDSEIAELRKRSEAEAAAEEERIKAAAEEDRRKVIEGAEQEIEAAAKAARRDLKAYAASLAVSLAEKKIHVDQDTDRALVSGFVRDLGRNGSGRSGR